MTATTTRAVLLPPRHGRLATHFGRAACQKQCDEQCSRGGVHTIPTLAHRGVIHGAEEANHVPSSLSPVQPGPGIVVGAWSSSDAASAPSARVMDMRSATVRRVGARNAIVATLLTLSTLLAPLPAAASAAEPEGSVWRPEEGRELLGEPAPEWRNLRWLQGGPLTLEDLRGRAVLLRFWLVDCPWCRRTAPALVDLHERYRDRGLVVVGIHHPKSEAARDPDVVRRAAERYGFDFPVALDNAWTTIRAYGVGTHFRRFTSISFLVGPDGTIRWIHDGGAYRPGEDEEGRAYDSLVAAIEEWLPEPSEPAASDRD